MNEYKGYIKLYRKILDNPLFSKSPERLYIWLYLLINATHKEQKVLFDGNEITLRKGQLITGRKKISDETGLGESLIDRVLKKFENNQIIEQQKTSRGRLISIKKWSTYQVSEQQANNKRTTSEQQANTNNNVDNVDNVEKEEIYKEEKEKKEDSFYDLIQSVLGRTLFTSEIIKTESWNYPDEILKLALDEAILSNELSIRYIDGIIQNWKSLGVKTIQDAKKCIDNHKKKKEQMKGNDSSQEEYYREL